MKVFAVIEYKFQGQLCKCEPRVESLFYEKVAAEKHSDELHAQKWSALFGQGVINDAFEVYQEKITKDGFDIRSSSLEQARKFVAYLKTSTIEVYGDETTLQELFIYEVMELEDQSNAKSTRKWLVLRQDLLYYGEHYQANEQGFGIPIACCSTQEAAQKAQDQLELSIFKEEVLQHKAFQNIETSLYYSDVVWLSPEQMALIKEKTKTENIPIDNFSDLNTLAIFKNIVEEVANCPFVPLTGIVEVAIK